MNLALGLSKDELETSALIVDMDKLEFNLKNMAEFARSQNINLRPHIKTHKSPDIAEMQINHGASGIACAKTGEAEIMATHHVRNIHVVYLIVGRRKVERILKLTGSTKIIGLVDGYEQAKYISNVLGE